MEVSPQVQQISQLVALVAWTLAYALMARRGLKDKTFGMPILALAIDISWEFYFTFFSGWPIPQRAPAAFWFALNLGVLYTVYRYGRDDFEWPLLRRWFGTVVSLSLGIAFFLLYNFVQAFDDHYGALSASFAMLVYTTLLPVMLIRRNSIRGQSIYIAILILVGDLGGFFATVWAQANLDTNLPAGWMYAINLYVLPCHLFYVWLVWWVARRDGINPWKRL